jgi:glycosyltransferase involved in cell wall biosynthesis
VNAAIFFESDAYSLDGPRLMGRQSAGNGFLRAAVAAHGGEPIYAVAAKRATAETFARMVKEIDPAAKPHWIPARRLDLLAAHGAIYRPDVGLGPHARERLRIGADGFSVCGVTHTLSSHGAMDLLADMVCAPIMPWDALICTSTAARGVVEAVVEDQADYLAWRLGASIDFARPQLPIIPLGVHAEDFAFKDGERETARAGLEIADDEAVALFVGRLTFNAKAHPFQMYRGLEAAARASDRPVVFLLAGQFPSQKIEGAFRASAREICPSVRVQFVDGKDALRFGQAWRAADLFLSISDNVQETFGLTPLEAMAAGLPVVVSDWDGYKDTVRDGLDGFRIPSWAPSSGVGQRFAADYETLTTDFDYFLSRTSTTVSVDPGILADRLATLVQSPDLRRRMGAAGAAHVRSNFDWRVVYGRHQALWRELDEIRRRRAAEPALRLAAAPRAAPARPDPFAAFAHYPSRVIGSQTRVGAAPGAGPAAYQALTSQAMLSFWKSPPETIERIFAELDAELTLAELAERLQEPVALTIERVARLAKMELVKLRRGEEEP